MPDDLKTGQTGEQSSGAGESAGSGSGDASTELLPPDEVIDAEYEVGTPLCVARVKSVHEKFSWLCDAHRGTETLETNGDIFCPTTVFEVGAHVTFKFEDLRPNPEKPGRFRADNVTELRQELAVPGSMSDRALTLAIFRETVQESPYHKLAKRIAEADINQAAENLPFGEWLKYYAQMIGTGEGLDLVNEASRILESTYPSMGAFGFTYDIGQDHDDATDDKALVEHLKAYSDLPEQQVSIRSEYNRFKGLRWVFYLMRKHKILRLDMLLPDRFFPELFTAAPVLFSAGNGGPVLTDEATKTRPRNINEHICARVPSKEFAWFYQMYNYQQRPLTAFNGRDIIPPALNEVLKVALQIFDYVAIMTPYHDIAGEEWANGRWLRNVDPFLVGFMRDVPYVFILGRWSGTNLFPRFLDMLADTMNHVRQNKGLLANFGKNLQWIQGLDVTTIGDPRLQLQLASSDTKNTVLEPFADELLAAFDNGRLFEFLRGEKPVLTTDPAADIVRA
ncbi:MAG: hypothetical protein UT91_C0011G0016 [Parcubacteria group bacterium GW2011_GWA2_40_23]|nr:MAG: hypothetical protein UT91_C0011G0016 [Parcubacteria group bacterium GW2011_GWA2_40_23]